MKEDKNQSDLAYMEAFLKQKIKTVSPEEIIAAGGAEAYAIQKGFDKAKIKSIFENAPKTDPITEEGWEEFLAELQYLKDTK
ncbi:MAG: hypothetical protein MUE85_20345 [Microscillaceae bacterium]|jgi:hypothetical protein|nr:hypothetical protein [Microscillaceae bacterium]